jgi:hypothetical protein
MTLFWYDILKDICYYLCEFARTCIVELLNNTARGSRYGSYIHILVPCFISTHYFYQFFVHWEQKYFSNSMIAIHNLFRGR